MALTDKLQNRDDDSTDHIDSDTPRSGVATPQPDPSDKRLPGIMHSYFGQVGSGSSTSPNSGPLETPALGTESENPVPFHRREEMRGDEVPSSVAPDSSDEAASNSDYRTEEALPLPKDEWEELSHAPAPENSRTSGLHPYPTPPVSHPPSLHKLKLSDSSSEEEKASARREASSILFSAHRKSLSESIPSSARRASFMNPLSSVVTASNVHAAHFSSPSDPYPATTQSTPAHSRLNSEFHESPSYERLKRLTDDALRTKSIPPTPTRALSNQTAKSDNSGGSEPANSQNSNGQNGKQKPAEVIPTPPTLDSAGAPVVAPKGKLTVKIAEARGLRKSRDPYVVAVFQRNELVSKGPLPQDRDDNEEATTSGMGIPMGGIPISRSGSDSGRPMAIPMKSRQSSNTSFSGERDFKINGRRSMTNPKWDTEAVL
jgi:serine/threonine protein kinase SCH9